MKEHEKILKLIEEVDPNDTAMLDEIDARVSCFVNTTYEQVFIGLINRRSRYGDGFEFKSNGEIRDHNLTKKYTRSRDALKAIRPEGWEVVIGTNRMGSFFSDIFNSLKRKSFSRNRLPTEELAELHAIIQAIAHDRENNTNNSD